MTKNKSNLKSPRLTKGVKNLLKEKAGVVLFEREADKYPKKVVISNKSKEVKINIVSDPLDVYASPHILDLSRLRFIERYQSAGLAATAAYNDLPVGDVLSKLFIFDFLAFEKSEILLALKLIWQKTFNSLRDSFYPVDFSPKLPLLNRKSDWQEKLADWQEISFVNFIVFIYSFVAKVFSFCYWLGYLAGQIIADYFRKKDEVIKMAPESAQAIKIEEKTTDIFAEPEIFIPIQETRQVFAPEFHPLAGFFRKIRQTDFSARLPELNWGINFDFKRLSVQPVAVFILIALAVVMPIKALNYWQKIGEVKGLVLGEADAAIRNLESAQGELYNFNLDEAKDYFVSANKNFISAQAQLKEIQSFLTVLAELSPADNTWRAGKNLLDLGANLSSAGSHLLNGLNGLADLSQVIDEKIPVSDTHGVVAASASKGNGASLVEKIKNLKAESSLALMELKSAQGNLAQINIQKLPAENQWQFEKLKKELPNLITNLDKSQGLMQFLVGFLGEKDLRRYLFIFQNDNELRATGGFMGSFSLVDLKNGNVAGVNLPAGGTYDTRAGLKEMLQAPKPMQIVGYRWEFQDANWWPDWPTSASKVAWFFEKSGGPTVDGVIAINSDWLGKLLQTTGPIDLPDYKKTITAANFETELQTSIEVDATVKNRPKQILADLAPKLIERILSIKPEKFLALAQSLNEGLAQKDILIYLRDENLQKFASANNWDGRQQDYNFDYLSVVATNIAGGKTDNVIKQKIYHQATIQKDNSVIVNLLIDRSNFGPIDDVFTKTPNRSYLRVYAPLGAKLVKALGFVQPSAKAFKPVDPALKIDESLITENEAVVDYASQTKIYNENGRTVFGNWVTLNPGESRDLLLVYELPAKLKTEVAPAEGWTGKIKAAFFENRPATYGLLVQKQPGENDDEFFSNVIYPDGFEPQTGAGLNIDAQNQEVNFKGILVEDLEYEVKFLIP